MAAFVAFASLSSSARWAGESLAGRAPGSAFVPAVIPPSGAEAGADVAVAAPDGTATAMRAAAAIRAPVAVARRLGVES